MDDYAKVIFNWLKQFAPTFLGVAPPEVVGSGAYINYEIVENAEFGSNFVQSINLYQLNTASIGGIYTLKNKIEKAISHGGVLVGGECIKLLIQYGSPFFQNRPLEEQNVKAGLINLQIIIFNS